MSIQFHQFQMKKALNKIIVKKAVSLWRPVAGLNWEAWELLDVREREGDGSEWTRKRRRIRSRYSWDGGEEIGDSIQNPPKTKHHRSRVINEQSSTENPILSASTKK